MIDITTTDLELQTVELLPARAALAWINIAGIGAVNHAFAANVANFGPASATAVATQAIVVTQT